MWTVLSNIRRLRGPRWRRGVHLAYAIVFLWLWDPSAAAGASEIGAVNNVIRVAYGTPPADQRSQLRLGEQVISKEIVETTESAALHIRFFDGSDFHLGSTSRATLDDFLYDPSSRDGKMTLLLKEGIFRFKTGEMKVSGVRVVTPVAIITPAGTEFIVQVLASGAMTVEVISGAVTITPLVAALEPAGATTVTAPGTARVLEDGTVQGNVEPPPQDEGIALLSRFAALETEGPPITSAGPTTLTDRELGQREPGGRDGDRGGTPGGSSDSGNGGGDRGSNGGNGSSGGRNGGADGGNNGGPDGGNGGAGNGGDGNGDGGDGNGDGDGGNGDGDGGHAGKSRAGGLDGTNPGRGRRGPGVGANNPSGR